MISLRFSFAICLGVYFSKAMQTESTNALVLLYRSCFTYVTTNLQPKDFSRIYGERVADRLREMATIINYQNPSFRK